MRPFLLVATRAEDVVADEEYEAFRRFGGLAESELERRRVERDPLGDVDLDAYSGLILGGSPFTISDEDKPDVQLRVEEELGDLARRVIAADFPFLGTCYGIGIIGRTVGAEIDRTYGEEVSAPLVTLTDAGQDDPLFEVMPRQFAAFVGHKEAVRVLPDDAVVLASSRRCPIQAFRVARNGYATQFHPELDVPGIKTRIEAYKHHDYFPSSEAEAVKSMADASGVEVPARLVERFVELYGQNHA